MLIRSVIQHEVQNDPYIAVVGFTQKRFEIVQRSIFRRDASVIRNVIAAIPIGGGEVRREPDGIHAEIRKIIQLFDHAFEIANTIAISIRERTWIDLIKNCSLPPFQVSHALYPYLY